MIEVNSAIPTETRVRDQLRNRILLKIGSVQYHLSRVEAEKLSGDLTTLLESTHKPEAEAEA